MKKVFLYTLSLWLMTFQAAMAQFPEYTFRYYDAKSGLRDNEVYNIAQDDAGFMWIGTSNGLHRFDGVHFRVFEPGTNPAKGPAKGNYRFILKHSDGSLWIATDYDGASRYFPMQDKFLHYRHVESQPNTIGDVAAYKLIEDLHHNIWFAHYFKGVSMFDVKTGQFTRYRHRPGDSNSLLSNNIYALCQSPDNHIWIGYQHHGLSEYDPVARRFSHYSTATACGLTTDNTYAICFDKQKTLWISTDKGIFYKRNGEKKFTRYAHPLLKEQLFFNLYLNNLNGLLYATSPSGLHVINPNDNQLKIYLLDAKSDERMTVNRCTNLFFDKDNRLWIQFNEGFCMAYERQNTIEKAENIGGVGYMERINHFEVKHRNLIWNIVEGKLCSRNLTDGSLNYYPHALFQNLQREEAVIHQPNQRSVWISIHIKQKGLLLFNTASGLFKQILMPDNRQRVLGKIYDAMCDSKGDLWMIDAFEGLLNYNGAKNQWRVVNPSQSRVNNDFFYYHTKFHEDRFGNVWCLNPFFKLIKFKAGTQKPEVFAHNNNPFSISDQMYFSVFEDGAGNLWLAGNNNLLDFYDANGLKFYHFQRKGCFEEKIYNIIMDRQHNLWLFGQQSIARMRPPQRLDLRAPVTDNFTYSSFNWKNGVNGHYFGNNYVFAIGDTLFFDSKEGLLQLDAKAWDINRTPAPVYITGLSVNGQPFENGAYKGGKQFYGGWQDGFLLESDQNNIEFSFSAISYNYAESNRFRYRLLNYSRQDEFCNAQMPVAVFHNLPPGEYTLEVSAANNDGIWNPKPLTFTFSIRQPFIQSMWFKLIILGLVLGLVIIFYRLKINEILKLQNVRNRISRDLHDNIGATISSASFSAKLLEDKLDNHEQGKALTGKIRNDIHELGESIDDIVWSVNPDNDTWNQLFTRMRRYGSGILESAGINYRMSFPREEDTDTLLKTDVRKELFLVYKEAVNNAVKHSGATMVEINVEHNKYYFEMTISDNGKGFDSGLQTERNGLKNMQARVAGIKGRFEIMSEKGKGTTVLVKV